MRAKASDVQTMIVECVDSALEELGQSVKKVIYFQFEKNFGIKKDNIPDHPEAFSKALHSIFGQGANVIEELIVRKIQEKFKLHLKPETSLMETVQAIMKSCKQPLETEVSNI